MPILKKLAILGTAGVVYKEYRDHKKQKEQDHQSPNNMYAQQNGYGSQYNPQQNHLTGGQQSRDPALNSYGASYNQPMRDQSQSPHNNSPYGLSTHEQPARGRSQSPLAWPQTVRDDGEQPPRYYAEPALEKKRTLID